MTMAPQDPPEHPLDVLPAMINLVLLQTTKVFGDPALHDPKNVVDTNARMTEIIPGALNRYHSALDALEVEIVCGARSAEMPLISEVMANMGLMILCAQLHAKAVIDRDLTTARARRVEKQRKALKEQQEAVTQIDDANSESLVNASTVRTDVANNTMNAAESVKAATTDNADAMQVDPPQDEKPHQEPTTQLSSQTRAEAPKPDASIVPHNAPAKSSPKSSAPEQPPATTPKTSDPPSSTPAPVATTTTTTTTAPEMPKHDFDSMFAENPASADPVAEPSDLTFNLDFSVPDGSINVQPAPLDSNDPSATNPVNMDMDAFLPGLESYGSAPDDVALLDVPPPDGTLGADPQRNAQPPGDHHAHHPPTFDPSSTTLDDIGAPESTNFDDLFFNANDFGIGDGGPGGDAQGTGEEGTQGNATEFDDAFFGLDGS
ncbi:MAG: hypothetical protein M1817_005745 [Caeruleum heppii]|nr:MAG: hypothetical protein M1817_005745 [Caeruleum heppii]